jgi:hypothetical protein
MTIEGERRALQAALVVGCLVPLLAGGAGMVAGANMLRGIDAAPADLDSHFRYLSGLLFGVGIGFLSCVPRIEARGERMRLLGLIVLFGGLARAWSVVEDGAAAREHQLALVMELVVVPLLLIWQWRFSRRWYRQQKP